MVTVEFEKYETCKFGHITISQSRILSCVVNKLFIGGGVGWLSNMLPMRFQRSQFLNKMVPVLMYLLRISCDLPVMQLVFMPSASKRQANTLCYTSLVIKHNKWLSNPDSICSIFWTWWHTIRVWSIVYLTGKCNSLLVWYSMVWNFSYSTVQYVCKNGNRYGSFRSIIDL